VLSFTNFRVKDYFSGGCSSLVAVLNFQISRGKIAGEVELSKTDT